MTYLTFLVPIALIATLVTPVLMYTHVATRPTLVRALGVYVAIAVLVIAVVAVPASLDSWFGDGLMGPMWGHGPPYQATDVADKGIQVGNRVAILGAAIRLTRDFVTRSG